MFDGLVHIASLPSLKNSLSASCRLSIASQGILASDVGVGIKTDEPNTKPKPKLTKPNFQFL